MMNTMRFPSMPASIVGVAADRFARVEMLGLPADSWVAPGATSTDGARNGRQVCVLPIESASPATASVCRSLTSGKTPAAPVRVFGAAPTTFKCIRIGSPTTERPPV